MQIQCVTVKRLKGIGKKSGAAYDFQIIGGLVSTSTGTDFAEIVLDGDAPTPESGKRYEIEFEFYPDQEKRLAFKVVTLRPALAAAKSA